MAYPQTRSANRSFEAGATDGKYRKVIADRGGVVEHTFVGNRTDLTSGFYGIHEAPVMEMPGTNRTCTNPFAVSTPKPSPEYF